MLSSDASYTATYNYSDADGNYTGLLQSETKTLPEVENLPLIPDVNIQVTLYTYDANGNQLTVTDYEGNIKNYAYDGLNQLISYSDDENTASYTYRMDGMRRSKTVNGTTITHAGEVRAQIVLALAMLKVSSWGEKFYIDFEDYSSALSPFANVLEIMEE